MRWLNILFVAFAFLAFSASFVFAEGNLTQEQVAANCLNESSYIISDLTNYNVSSNRFNDYYSKAGDLYAAQLIIQTRKGKVDFTQVIVYCDQIKKMHSTAINAYDVFRVFLNFYNETVDKNMNTSSIDVIINQINAELVGERYENVATLVDTGYIEITSVKSEQTALALAYKTTTKNLKDFFKENWISLSVAFVLLLLFYLFYRTKITEWILKGKLDSLTLRRVTLKKLMEDAQRDYFQTGKLSEADYRIRIKNFADLIRDIDRQIPLIQKDLMNYNRKDELKKLEERDKKRK
jgi:hypothetical protein